MRDYGILEGTLITVECQYKTPDVKRFYFQKNQSSEIHYTKYQISLT